jgi:branched-chain amino acid transport system ATP-binding protein
MTILWTENITMRFGGLIAVHDFNLQVEDGQIVALIGPNGAGKTTVFNMISGIYSPTCGEIFYRDENINGIRPDQVAAKGIARTFQNIRLFNNLTVIENVLIGMTMNAKQSLIAKMFRTPGAIAEEK